MSKIQFEGIFENYDEIGFGFIGVISGLTYRIVSFGSGSCKDFLEVEVFLMRRDHSLWHILVVRDFFFF